MLSKIRLFIFFLKEANKGGENMAMVYVLLLMKGLKTYDEIPKLIRPQVNELLVEMELEYLIQE